MLRSSLRVLERRDVPEALEVCAADPIANLFVSARLVSPWAETRTLQGELWGWFDGGRMRSLCWSGANLVPVEATADALEAFAHRARRTGRHCSSIVGPADAVLALWARLETAWGPPREVRPDQPLMALAGRPAVAGDPEVRRSRPDELDQVFRACAEMFTEEIGYSPLSVDGGAAYHAQVAALVTAGRSFVRTADLPGGRDILFKAELGSVTAEAVQVQGVWVHPSFRGRGLAAPGMAALCEIVQREIAPVVSLYANAFNVRAVRAYERVGFRTVGTFATVLF